MSRRPTAFQELCDELKRNDPDVTTVTTSDGDTPQGYGRRLSAALLHNTMVTEIDFNLPCFLSKTEQKAETTKAAEPLLQWLEHTSSLTTVEFNQTRSILQPVDRLLLQRMLEAMAKNAHGFCTIEFNLWDFPLTLWTAYLETMRSPMTRLSSLKLNLAGVGRESVVVAVAKATRALSALKVLDLKGQSYIAPFMQELRGHGSLCRLTLNFGLQHAEASSVNVAWLTDVLRDIKQLSRVVLQSISWNDDNWKLVAVSGLAANPTITDLTLVDCRFTLKATKLFLRTMRSNNASQQHIRRLYLIRCEFILVPPPALRPAQRQLRPDGPPEGTTATPRPKSLSQAMARMLCGAGGGDGGGGDGGSLLNHLTLDAFSAGHHDDTYPNNNRADLRRFGNRMARNNSDRAKVRLSSLRLDDFDLKAVPHLAKYLVGTATLRHLTINARTPDRFYFMPNSFMHVLRANGSLLSMAFLQDGHEPFGLGDRHKRLIRAFTTRNQVLPMLLPSSLVDGRSRNSDTTVATMDAAGGAGHGTTTSSSSSDDDDDDDDDDGDTGSTNAIANGSMATKGMSPALCLVAQQTPQTAYNTLMRGLMAASNDTIGSRSGSTTGAAGRKRLLSIQSSSIEE